MSVKKEIILVVEDEPINIKVLGAILKDDYSLRIATNGEKALELARVEPVPNLVLLDIMMPGIDGHEVCKRLKSNPATKNIPVIFISAKSDEADEALGFEIGAVDYIAKPFSSSLVLARVATHLQINRNAVKLRSEIQERKRTQHELIAAKEQAEEATKAKSEFLANMSHEIRTPMNAIKGFTHLALKTQLTVKQQDYLVKTQNASNSLLGIINDILDFSKIEAGKLEIEDVDFDLEEVLGNLSNLVIQKTSEKKIELLFSVGFDVPMALVGDPLRLGQVLINLTNNAIKFTDKGEILITISVLEKSAESAQIQFAIRDSGIGLTEQQQGNLFQAFSQADTSTTRKYGGTGLGLTISKQLVEMMGGEIKVESMPGVGSTFTFNAEFGTRDVTRPEFTKVFAQLKEMKTLVVDDNETSRDILNEMMENLSVDVTAVASGDRAISEFMNSGDKSDGNPYRIVLMDWRMPGMDGLEATQRIKELKQSSDKPIVIMISAADRDEVMGKAGSDEVDAFIQKPVTRSLLLDTIMNCFGMDAMSGALALDNGDMQAKAEKLIRGARVLLVDDNEINQQVGQEILEGAGILVELADDGLLAVEAVRNAADGYFDAVLMDLQMPEMDGFGATKVLLAEDRFRDLPIIAMTAHALIEERKKCLDAGMVDHIAKPIDPELLFATLIKHIPPKASGGAEQTGQAPEDTKKQDDADLLPDELPPYDIQAALGRLNGKKKLLRKLLIKFHDMYVDLIPTLNQLAESENHDEIRIHAHTLKGGAGNLEAKEVFESAKALENALTEENLEELPQLISSLEKALKPALDAAASLR